MVDMEALGVTELQLCKWALVVSSTRHPLCLLREGILICPQEITLPCSLHLEVWEDKAEIPLLALYLANLYITTPRPQ